MRAWKGRRSHPSKCKFRRRIHPFRSSWTHRHGAGKHGLSRDNHTYIHLEWCRTGRASCSYEDKSLSSSSGPTIARHTHKNHLGHRLHVARSHRHESSREQQNSLSRSIQSHKHIWILDKPLASNHYNLSSLQLSRNRLLQKRCLTFFVTFYTRLPGKPFFRFLLLETTTGSQTRQVRTKRGSIRRLALARTLKSSP